MSARSNTEGLVVEARAFADRMDRVFGGPDRSTEEGALMRRLADAVAELEAKNVSLSECLYQARFTVSLLRAWQVSPEQLACLRRDLTRGALAAAEPRRGRGR